MKLENKIVLVTGGAKGIGRAIALEAAKEGAHVAIADILDEEAQKVADEISIMSRRNISIVADVTKKTDIERMIEKTLSAFSRIDVFFNNAGIIDAHDFLDVTEKEWDSIMEVNAKGVFFSAQHVARVMKKQGSGVIINTSSVASKKAKPRSAPYGASKAAVTSLTWSMALALAPHGIRVNAIAPGLIITDASENMDKKSAELFGIPKGEMMRRRISIIPLGRAGAPEEVAKVAVFLASDEASYINGQVININGGDLMQ